MKQDTTGERLRRELYTAVEERLRITGMTCAVQTDTFSAAAPDGASLTIDGRSNRWFAKVTMSFPGQRPQVLTIRRCEHDAELLHMADDKHNTVDVIAAEIAAAFVRLFA
jgi:hypothetical protein